jgi:hypothetical protein
VKEQQRYWTAPNTVHDHMDRTGYAELLEEFWGRVAKAALFSPHKAKPARCANGAMDNGYIAAAILQVAPETYYGQRPRLARIRQSQMLRSLPGIPALLRC